MAASFVLGLCFGKAVRKRGVSTASAIADSLRLESSIRRVLVLFDGRRDELLAFGLERDGAFFKPSEFHAVLDKNALEPLQDYDAFAALEKDRDRIREIAGEETVRKLYTVSHVSAAHLILHSQEDFTNAADGAGLPSSGGLCGTAHSPSDLILLGRIPRPSGRLSGRFGSPCRTEIQFATESRTYLFLRPT